MLNAIKKFFSGGKAAEHNKPLNVETCPDCGTQSGELHDLFCTKERCPFCGNQLITCDCQRSILKLSDDELAVLDASIDDSIPPLSDIQQRWKDALAEKGRVPFEAYPDEPIRAAFRGDVDTVKAFFARGFKPNTGNEVGYTLIMAAARGAKPDMIRYMLSRGESATIADKRGYTALHWAVAQTAYDPLRQIACVVALVEAKADVNARNEEGITPLMNAAWFGCVDAVRELLRYGADPSLKDDKGRTGKDRASTRGHTDVMELLK